MFPTALATNLVSGFRVHGLTPLLRDFSGSAAELPAGISYG